MSDAGGNLEPSSPKDNGDIYTVAPSIKFKIILLAVLLAVAGLVFNFPLETKILGFLSSKLGGNKQCPVFFKDVRLTWFLPRADFVDTVISGKCLGKPEENISLDEFYVELGFPGLLPPNLKLDIRIKGENSVLNITPRLSLSPTEIKIEKSKIDARLLKLLLAGAPDFSGTFDLNSFLQMGADSILDARFSITSNNLLIPEQTVSGFALPALPLNYFILKGTYATNIVTLESFMIGEENSPLKANFKGTIAINLANMGQSILDLTGDLFLSQKIIDAFPLITMMLGDKKTANGSYKLKLTGFVSAPRPQFL